RTRDGGPSDFPVEVAMYRYIITVFIVLSVVTAAAAMPADEIADMVTRAESLYFGAKFKDAIQLLQRIDEMLRSRTDRVTEKITVKLQLALAHVGLNDAAQAKTSLRELYVLDPEYRLDPQLFPPKVILLADEVKAEAAGLLYKTGVEAYKAGQ